MAFGLPLGKHVKIFCPNVTGVVAGQWNGREDPEADAAEIQRARAAAREARLLGARPVRTVLFLDARRGVAALVLLFLDARRGAHA